MVERIAALQPWPKALLYLGRTSDWRDIGAAHAMDYVFSARVAAFISSCRAGFDRLRREKKTMKELTKICKKLRSRSWGSGRNMHGNVMGPQIVECCDQVAGWLEDILAGEPYAPWEDMRDSLLDGVEKSWSAVKKATKTMSRSCNSCGREEAALEGRKKKLNACARCRLALYCSKECQVADWKRGHKQTCTPVE